MTYKIEPGIARISSPVVLVYPDMTESRYENGLAATQAVFDKSYRVVEIRAVDYEIELVLEKVIAPTTNWCGEEQTFF